MDTPLSRKWNPEFYRNIQQKMKWNVSLGRRRIKDITNGLTMPEITGLSIGSAKRMEAAVLFFDLEDFTSTTSTIAQEQTLHLLNLNIPTVMQIVRNWQGEIEKNTGDGIMVIFGTETRDSAIIARDAIECAMAIRFVMTNDIFQKIIELHLPVMNFRIGIDMDQLLIARIGIHSYSFLTAVGSGANRAAKLQSLARSNGICIGNNLRDNLHPMLYEYCEEGSDPSWRWIRGNPSVPYGFFHFLLDWPPPSEWIKSLIRRRRIPF